MSGPDPSLSSGALAIAGCGRVGTALGRLLSDRGMPVTAVWSRNEARARAAASFISPTTQVASLEDLPRLATRVLITVPDDAVGTVAKRVAGGGEGLEIAMHTSGVLDRRALDALAQKGVSCGSIHPLQTVPSRERGVEVLPGSLFAIEGDDVALRWAERAVRLLNGKLLRLAPQAKPFYHAAATLAGNGVTALVAAAEKILARGGFFETEARTLLQPLMEASLRNTASMGPPSALTGPVARGDRGTVAQHWRVLAECEDEVRELYRAVALVLISVAEGAHGERKERHWIADMLKDAGRQP